jgi:hypothetical protein
MKKYIITGIVLLAASCQKIVKLNLKNSASQVVIQGEVTDTTGPYTVTLNRSEGFYQENNFSPITDASVQITDNTGFTDTLLESAPGVYNTQKLQGVPGNSYNLIVEIGDTSYSGVSTMPQPVALDSISFQVTNDRQGQSNITAYANFQDPASVSNYYQFLLYINDSLFTQDIFVYSDRLSNGKYTSYALRMDSTYLNPGDQIQVKMYCIEEGIFNYFRQLDISNSGGAFNTTASPANPTTTLSNNALGYFSAHTTRSKTTVVP